MHVKIIRETPALHITFENDRFARAAQRIARFMEPLDRLPSPTPFIAVVVAATYGAVILYPWLMGAG